MATIRRKLVVEVVDARNLLPKDGHGTSSPYVVVDFYGQRKRTQTAVRELNPAWNEALEFNVGPPSDVFGDTLELDVYHDKNFGPTRRNNFLGRIRLSSSQFVRKGEEALIYFPLEKKNLFSWIQGDIGLKVYYVDEAVPPPSPPSPPPPPPAEPIAEVKSETTPPPVSNPLPAAEAAQENAAVKSETDPPAPPPDEAAPPPPEVAPPPPEAAPPPAEAAQTPFEAAPPPDEAAPPSDANPQPPDVSVKVVEAPASSVQEMQLETGNDTMASKWAPPPYGIGSRVSIPDVKITGNNRVQTIPGQSLAQQDSIKIEPSSYDLVEKMHYLFVRVVKARSLPTNGNPVVKIAVSGFNVRSRPARKATFFEWDQIFAFCRESPESSSILEVSVWDPPSKMDPTSDMAGQNFLGGICFEVAEIPLRDPPDSPLAPQWYRLEGGGAHSGDLMLATWVGTQADDAFPDAWKTDTTGNHLNSRSKIYLSPKLWYLRATVIEAQDVLPLTASKEPSFLIRAQLGFQVMKTKLTVTHNGSPSWNEDLMFVAAEPFAEHLVFTLENRLQKGPVSLGIATIPLTMIERRVDDRKVASRWLTFEDPNNEKKVYRGRVHLRLCFDGGYHVTDEAAHVCSDFRPTAKQLWKPHLGVIELGIVGCKNLVPMKAVNGKGSTDAYSVAKYGQKWVRTRTVSDCLEPRWNEQYTWKVYDPCTVLTVGVFDNWGIIELDGPKDASRPDLRIGKVRIRISTLEIGKVYRNSYPLLFLSHTGPKKMGEIEIAIRFVRTTATLDLLHVYSQPLLPLMHHIRPLGVVHQEMLRNTAVKLLAAHLSRSEPPLKHETVLYMLDADSHAFSMRKVRANWFRIINVIAGVIDAVRWLENTRAWKNPTATVLVHALLVMLVWFPDLIVPTLAFYLFVIGAWNYRFRARDPLPHPCPKISLAEIVDRDELDEEFDTFPSTRSNDVVRARYDKLRTLGARVQNVLGDLATQGERLQALVTWRDPRATGIFIGMCLIVAVALYLVPSKMVAMASGFYYFRHPLFRDRMPSPALNFFRRLPSLSDRTM